LGIGNAPVVINVGSDMTAIAEKNKELIKQAFRHIIEAETVDEKQIARFFSPDYIQHVDGHTIGYDEIVRHLYEQRRTIAAMEVNFLALAGEGNLVFTNHVVSARRKDGGRIKVKVIAQFTFQGDKIVSCDELTHMISGRAEDKDLGSRH